MYLPSVFGDNLLDDFDDFFDFDDRSPLYGKHAKNLMRTDIRELDNAYELDVDLPGFKKDQIQVTLEDGYLTISTKKDLDRDQKNDQGKLVRRERYFGSMARSFYVGQDVKKEDISAKYEDGVLKLSIPKQEVAKEEPEDHNIYIE